MTGGHVSLRALNVMCVGTLCTKRLRDWYSWTVVVTSASYGLTFPAVRPPVVHIAGWYWLNGQDR